MLATLEATREETEQAYWEGIEEDITLGDHQYILMFEEKVVSPHAPPQYTNKRKQVSQVEPAVTDEPHLQAYQPLKRIRIRRLLGHHIAPHPSHTPSPSHRQPTLDSDSGTAPPSFFHIPATTVKIIVLLSSNLKLVTFLNKYYYFCRRV